MSQDPTVISVRPATATTVRAAAEVLAHAFADDPTIARFVAPGVSNRHRRLVDMFLSEMHTCGFERVDTAVRTDTGEVVGAAVWAGPGHVAPRWVAARWYLVWVRSLRLSGMRVARTYEKGSEPHRPAGPHWHLLDIGAAPSARGLGVGRALLQHRLAVVDAEGLPARLEATTDASRRLYERFGFTLSGRLPEDVGGAYAMVRAAQR